MNIEKRSALMPFSWEQIVGDRRPGHTVVTPKTRWWLARRAVFVWLWSRAMDYGLRHNFIEWINDYDSSDLVATEHREDRKWVSE